MEFRMTRMAAIASALTAAAFAVLQARAAETPPALTPGLYEVDVRLELPHIDDATARKTATICVSGDGAQGLAVLSDNNPLAKCPVSNVRREGAALAFDIACAGGNAAIASAKYVLAPNAFQGRIAMKMGGKNMTMTETQDGRRVGACAAAPAPPP